MAYRSKKPRSVDPIIPSCKKRIYDSKAEAEEMIRHIQETRIVQGLHAYECPICGMWHLTSKTE